MAHTFRECLLEGIYGGVVLRKSGKGSCVTNEKSLSAI